MKVLKKALKVLLGLIVVAIGLLYVTGNKHILSGITKTYFIGKSKPDIDDISYHHTRTIPAEAPNQWKESVYLGEIESSDFDEEHQLYESAAYLVVHEDSVLYEKYWEGYDASCQLNSFSMAKSLLSLAVGIAVEEGHIQGVDQAAGDFLPWLKEGESAALTIENLLTMSSGIDFGESYSNPFGYQAKAYYGDDLREATSAFQVTSTPGKIWKYEGGNSVLLGMILEQATGQKISTYFGEKIWSRIGAEHAAYWKLDDEDGLENSFSAIYSNPRDFARIGQLILNEGKYAHREVVPEAYIEALKRPVSIPDADGNVIEHYSYQWWLGEYEGKDLVYCRGLRGQYIIAVPEDNLVVVRFGHQRSEERIDNSPKDRNIWLEQAYSILKKKA